VCRKVSFAIFRCVSECMWFATNESKSGKKFLNHGWLLTRIVSTFHGSVMPVITPEKGVRGGSPLMCNSLGSIGVQMCRLRSLALVALRACTCIESPLATLST
jgi:hypothetical protein